MVEKVIFPIKVKKIMCVPTLMALNKLNITVCIPLEMRSKLPQVVYFINPTSK